MTVVLNGCVRLDNRCVKFTLIEHLRFCSFLNRLSVSLYLNYEVGLFHSIGNIGNVAGVRMDIIHPLQAKT